MALSAAKGACTDLLSALLSRPGSCASAGLATSTLALVGCVLWKQYSLLLYRNRPKTDLGLPFWGHTLTILKSGIEVWGKGIRKRYEPFDAALLFYLFQPAVLISNKLYREKIQKLDNDGELVTVFPPSLQTLIGEHSLIVLPGGKGHERHHRIRAKCMRALAPKLVLGQTEMLSRTVTACLEGLVRDTEQCGFGCLHLAAEHLAFSVSGTMILGEQFTEEVEQLRSNFNEIIKGAFAPPMDLGRFTAYGRARMARARLKSFIEELLTRPAIKRTALGELLAASEEGAALTKDEIADTVLTFLLAGQLTTKDAIPQLVIDLVENKQLVERIRAEANKSFASIEEDSVTLRFICESLKRQPPAGAFRRSCLTRDIDLGAAGIVPKGVSMACLVNQEEDSGAGINVDDPAYDDKQAFFDRLHSIFGGKQPHACAGKHIALLEMEIFLRELCAKYTIDSIDVTFQAKMGMAGWKDDLPIRLSHKTYEA